MNNVGNTLERIGTVDYFLNITAVEQIFRFTINKSVLLKWKSFWKSKGMVNETKQWPRQ